MATAFQSVRFHRSQNWVHRAVTEWRHR